MEVDAAIAIINTSTNNGSVKIQIVNIGCSGFPTLEKVAHIIKGRTHIPNIASTSPKK